MKFYKKIFSYWEIFILLILAGFILTRGIKKPFYGHHDWNGVQYGNIARNFARHGFLKTKFGQVENPGPIKNNYNYNTHHPSFFPILIGISFKIFGIYEWSARLIPITFSLGTILGLYFLGRLFFSRIIGFFMAALAGVTPMFVYFAKMPVHEPLILCFSVWSIYWYTKWIRSGKNKFFTLLTLASFLNGITGWPGYFLYPIITLHAFLYKKKYWKKTLILWLILLAAFSLHLLHVYILTGSITGGGLLEILLKRLNQETDPIQTAIIGFSWEKYAVQQARWLIVYFTRPLAASGLLVLLILFSKRSNPYMTKGLDLFESMIILTFLFAISYPLVFSNAVFIHDYLNIYFLPFFSLSICWILNKIAHFFSSKALLILGPLLLLLVAAERKDFVKALQQSNMHKIGCNLGLAIKEKTRFEEAIVISAPQFAAHFSKFAYFYADRRIGFWEGEAEEFKKEKLGKNYKFLITIDSMPVKSQLKQEFDKMESEKAGEFNFYGFD